MCICHLSKRRNKITRKRKEKRTHIAKTIANFDIGMISKVTKPAGTARWCL